MMKSLCHFSTIFAIIVSLYNYKSIDDISVKIVGTIAYIMLVILLCHIVSTGIKDSIQEKFLSCDTFIKKYSSVVLSVIGYVVYGSIASLSYLCYCYFNVESLFVPKVYPYLIIGLGIYAFCVSSMFSKEKSDK